MVEEEGTVVVVVAVCVVVVDGADVVVVDGRAIVEGVTVVNSRFN